MPTNRNNPAETPQQEAQRIFSMLFPHTVPEVLAERFALAAAQLDAVSSPQELRTYRHALAHIHDLEALELAARYRRQLPLLSRKLQLMAYLAEALPETRTFYIQDRDSLLAACLACTAAALRTAYKLVLGTWLLRSLDHA